MSMNHLPENCIAKILSFMTPRDVCRSSVVSKIFRSAAESDDVWNQFLPSDLSPAGDLGPPLAYLNKKSLFLALADAPCLINDGQMSLSLEKWSGKKCYMISPRTLSIAWGHDTRYWEWITHPGTCRFKEVAKLIRVWWFEISGRINISLLSDDTLYAAYLVYKLTHDTYGFSEPVEASVGFLLADNITHQMPPSQLVCLMRIQRREVRCAEVREDGWFEAELGQFYKRRDEVGEIEMSVKKTKTPYEKTGLILHGIEIRPIIYPS